MPQAVWGWVICTIKVKPLKKTYKQAVALSELACKANDLRACFNLAYYLELGYGTPKNMACALDLYQQTCELGYAKGCINLAVSYEEGKGVKPGYGTGIKVV